MKTVQAKQEAFWMGCCRTKTVPGKESQTLKHFFVYTLYTTDDITAYVYLQYMNASRQGVH